MRGGYLGSCAFAIVRVLSRSATLVVVLTVLLSLSSAATAWALPSSPYFTLLPESGETELHIERYGAVATALPNGEVLIAGGESEAGDHGLRSAELFDPTTDTFYSAPRIWRNRAAYPTHPSRCFTSSQRRSADRRWLL